MIEILHDPHWPLANIEIEGHEESFILAALAGLLGHAGLLPSTGKIRFSRLQAEVSIHSFVNLQCQNQAFGLH